MHFQLNNDALLNLYCNIIVDIELLGIGFCIPMNVKREWRKRRDTPMMYFFQCTTHLCCTLMVDGGRRGSEGELDLFSL